MSGCRCIGGLLKTSFIDFPGTVSTVLFFNGCNLRCPYCHNPSIVRGVSENISFEQVLLYCIERKKLLGGVVLSGGEPTLNSDLLDFTLELKKTGLKVKLDTNGLRPEIIEQVAPDFLALDIKTLPLNYSRLGYSAGDAADKLLKSVSIVKKMGKHAEIRITVVPDFINDENIAEIASMLAGCQTVYLQQFSTERPMLSPQFTSKKPYAIEKLHGFKKILEQQVSICRIRGE